MHFLVFIDNRAIRDGMNHVPKLDHTNNNHHPPDRNQFEKVIDMETPNDHQRNTADKSNLGQRDHDGQEINASLNEYSDSSNESEDEHGHGSTSPLTKLLQKSKVEKNVKKSRGYAVHPQIHSHRPFTMFHRFTKKFNEFFQKNPNVAKFVSAMFFAVSSFSIVIVNKIVLTNYQ